MKKLMYLALALVIAVGLCACGESETSGNTTTGKPSGTTASSTAGTTEQPTTGTEEHSHHFDEESGLCSCGLKASKGLDFELNDDGKSYKVTGIGDCTDTDVVIPDTYNSLPVTGIGDYSLWGCSSEYKQHSLTSVLIPDSVTSIGESAFQQCHDLTSIVIPSNVTNIGAAAFSGCRRLTSITVAEGNKVYHSVGNCLIETATKKLIAGWNISVIPSDGSVTGIGEAAFYLSSMTNIVIPDTVTYIDKSAFLESNITNLVIPDSVTYIGDCAFMDCDSLTNIIIPDSVTSIGKWVIRNCDVLKTINFDGTKKQWNAVRKGLEWDSNTGDYIILCTDGEYADLTASTTSVNLSPDNDFYQVVDITCTYSTVYWYATDTSIVSCEWGTFENGRCQLYITGKGVGTIPVYIFCSDDDNLAADDWASAPECITITVNVDISDSNEYVYLYNDDNGKYVTGQVYSYTGPTTTKSELVLSDNRSDGVRLRVRKNSDNTVTFISENGKYLYCDGTNVYLSTIENQFYTRYKIIVTSDGYYIKCANVTYNGTPQYLEVYSGYLTCYSYGSAADSQYVFKFISGDKNNTDDIFTRLKGYIISKGTYDYDDNEYNLTLGYTKDDGTVYYRTATYNVDDDRVTLEISTVNESKGTKYYLAIEVKQDSDGVYDWGYVDGYGYGMLGTVDARTFSSNTILEYTYYSKIPNTTILYTVRKLASSLMQLQLAYLELDLSDINFCASDLYFYNI